MEEEEGRGKGKRKNAHEQANRTKLGRRKKTVRMRSGAEWSEEEAGERCQGWETSGPRAIKCEPGPKLTNRTSTSRQREM